MGFISVVVFVLVACPWWEAACWFRWTWKVFIETVACMYDVSRLVSAIAGTRRIYMHTCNHV